MRALLGELILGLSGSVILRMFTALGITIGSYYGISTTVDTLITHIQTAYNGIGSTTLTLLNLAGFGEALGITLGSYITKAGLQGLKTFVGKAS